MGSKIIKGILFCMLVIFVCSQNSLAEEYIEEVEEERLKIERVGYEGFLSDDTMIKITGTEFDNCSSLYIKNKQILIQSKSDTEIAFKYSSVGNPNGNGELKCESENIKFYFNFPYITDAQAIDIQNFDGSIKVLGQNFHKNSNVVIEGGEFITGNKSKTLIVGRISEDTRTAGVHVEYEGNKSNEFLLNIKIPTIKFLYAKQGFYTGKRIIINGDHIAYNDNTELFIGEDKVKYVIDAKSGNIEFVLDEEPGTHSMYIIYNGLKSNELQLSVFGNESSIKAIYESDYMKPGETEEAGPEKRRAYAFETENVNGDLDGMKLWHNGEAYEVSFQKKNILYVEGISLVKGNNFFYVESHGSFSDVYNKRRQVDNYLPSTQSVVTRGFSDDDTMRNIRASMQYFDDDRDVLLLNGEEISEIQCVGNRCDFQVPVEMLMGSIGIKRNGIVSVDSYLFDFRSKNIPYIESITFDGTLRTDKLEINGQNFLDSEISAGDLLIKTSQDVPKVDLNVSNINAQLDMDIKQGDDEYRIGVSKLGETSELVFGFSDIGEKKIVYNTAKILSVGNRGEAVIGERVSIRGFGFDSDSKIEIGGNSIDFETVTGINEKIGYIVIPSYFELGEFDVTIKNLSGKKSEAMKISVLPQKSDVEITTKISQEENRIQNFTTHKELDEPLVYELEISDSYSDMKIDKISFMLNGKVQSQLGNFGTFILKYNDVIVGYSNSNRDGKIVFSTPFDVRKSTKNQTIELHKKSPFIYGGIYSITLDASGLELESKNQKAILQAVFTDILPTGIKIEEEESINCIASEGSEGEDNTCRKIELVDGQPQIEISKILVSDSVDIEGRLRNKEQEMNAFDKGASYTTKLNIIIPKVNYEKLIEVQNKLNAVSIGSIKNKRLKTFIEFMRLRIEYELEKK